MLIASLLAFLVVGALAGVAGGLLGLSGGVVTIPCLLLIFHALSFPQSEVMHMAVGTSLAAMIFNGIASTWAHHKRKGVIWKIVFVMLPGIVVGCIIGPLIASTLSGILLQVVFGLFITCLGIYLFLKKTKKQTPKTPTKGAYGLAGLTIGSIASLLGIGGGVFTVPLLIAHHHSEKRSVGTSAAIGLVVSFLAAIAYLYFGAGEIEVSYSLGYIYLPAFALVGVGAVFFAPVGAKLAHQIDGMKLRKIFAVTLGVIGLLMIFT